MHDVMHGLLLAQASGDSGSMLWVGILAAVVIVAGVVGFIVYKKVMVPTNQKKDLEDRLQSLRDLTRPSDLLGTLFDAVEAAEPLEALPAHRPDVEAMFSAHVGPDLEEKLAGMISEATEAGERTSVVNLLRSHEESFQSRFSTMETLIVEGMFQAGWVTELVTYLATVKERYPKEFVATCLRTAAFDTLVAAVEEGMLPKDDEHISRAVAVAHLVTGNLDEATARFGALSLDSEDDTALLVTLNGLAALDDDAVDAEGIPAALVIGAWERWLQADEATKVMDHTLAFMKKKRKGDERLYPAALVYFLVASARAGHMGKVNLKLGPLWRKLDPAWPTMPESMEDPGELVSVAALRIDEAFDAMNSVSSGLGREDIFRGLHQLSAVMRFRMADVAGAVEQMGKAIENGGKALEDDLESLQTLAAQGPNDQLLCIAPTHSNQWGADALGQGTIWRWLGECPTIKCALWSTHLLSSHAKVPPFEAAAAALRGVYDASSNWALLDLVHL